MKSGNNPYTDPHFVPAAQAKKPTIKALYGNQVSYQTAKKPDINCAQEEYAFEHYEKKKKKWIARDLALLGCSVKGTSGQDKERFGCDQHT